MQESNSGFVPTQYKTVPPYIRRKTGEIVLSHVSEQTILLSYKKGSTNGAKYIGDTANGKAQGEGIYYFADGGSRYVGQFADGNLEGNGTLFLSNGGIYRGVFKCGKFDKQHYDSIWFVPSTEYSKVYQEKTKSMRTVLSNLTDAEEQKFRTLALDTIKEIETNGFDPKFGIAAVATLITFLDAGLLSCKIAANEYDYNNSIYYFLFSHCGNLHCEPGIERAIADGCSEDNDHKNAFIWYRKCALRGCSKSQMALGIMYSNGQGVECDYVKAREWYEKASEQGHADATNNLAVLYYEGRGTQRDTVKGHILFKKAADLGSEIARRNLAT
jgi:hypothetical protein